MISIKSGVKVEGLKPEILLAIQVAYEVYKFHGYGFVITSVMDGEHIPNSKHYSGNAIDLRIWYVPTLRLPYLVSEIKSRLTDEFDVVLGKDHIHIEFDPK